jgi:uncharacterized RDD family membrane protein YckC
MSSHILTADRIALPRQRTTAGLGRRLGASILDNVILGVGFAMINLVLVGVLSETAAAVAYVLTVLAVTPAYGIITMLHGGQTPGKRASGIRVLTTDGGPVDAAALVKRELLAKTLLGTVTLGLFSLADCVAVLLSSDRRSLHDRIAGTVVVRG